MKNLLNLGLGLVFAAALANACSVSTLVIGGAQQVAGAACVVSGTVLGTTSGSYIGSTDISATYTDTAFADVNNPYGASDDTFVLKITTGANTGNNVIEAATLGGFAGLETTGAIASGSAQGAGVSESAGNTVKFEFSPTPGPGLTPGEVETVVVYTNFSGPVTADTISIQNSTAGNGVGLAPSPEPMSMSLLGGGLALLGALRFRRRQS